MTAQTRMRLGACVVAMLSAAAIAAPVAHATVTNQLDVGAQLLDQPKGQPWAVNLLLGASVVESTGQENLPITTKFSFQFPKAQVNTTKFGVCNATEPQPETREAQQNQDKSKNRSEHRHATFQLGNPFPNVSLSLTHLIERHYVIKATANPTRSWV